MRRLFPWLALALLGPVLVGAPLAGAAPGVPLALALAGPGAVPLGTPAHYAAYATGGTPPYLFAWSWNGTALQGNTSTDGNASTITLLPRGNAIYTLVVIVTDHSGNSTSQRTTVTVSGPGPLTVSLKVTGSGADGSIRVTAGVVGGTPPYTYRWTGPGAPGGWTTSANVTSPPLGNGAFNFSVVARDAYGFTGSATLQVRQSIAPPPAGLPWYEDLALGLAVALATTLAAVYVVRSRRRAPPRGPA